MRDERPAPATSPATASIARQLVRAIRTRLDAVSTAGRHGGETMIAARVILAEVELAPLAWLHRQQSGDGRDDRG